MKNIEFYTVDEKIMYIKDGVHYPLDERQKEIINYIASKIENMYPDSQTRLLERTKTLQYRPNYRRYMMVLRFCKCNFGNADTREMDINDRQKFRFEKVTCPLRGLCEDEGVICTPKPNSKLSPAERRIVHELKRGLTRKQIAQRLCLSPVTVRNHIHNIYDKLNLTTESQLIKYIIEEGID